MALSPMMTHYLEVKAQYPDAILFYRLGDFYEMFYEDAKTVSRELDLTLTGKQCGDIERAPMCGVPFHSSDTYIGKLVEKGYKVVICEQVEDPATAKGLVKREVVRIVTPGTVTDNKQLKEGQNNYLAAVNIYENSASLCFADISTGEIRATVVDDYKTSLINELAIYMPKELLINISADFDKELLSAINLRIGCSVWHNQAEQFTPAKARQTLISKLGYEAEDFKNIQPEIVCAIGALIFYISDTQKIDISYLKKPILYFGGQFMEIDFSTRRNLELTETLRSREKKGTLLWVLDKTRTSMGARLLRKWIEQPQTNANIIVNRQGAVKELVSEYMLRENLGDALRSVLDLERLMTKVIYESANAKDLRAISATISVLPEIKKTLALCKSDALSAIWKDLDTLDDLHNIIVNSIVEDPPFSIREGGFIAEGVNSELDKLRNIMNNSKDYLSQIEEREKDQTGIRNLKIGYNRVFGYYIEVSKSNVGQVPSSYIRKQTLTTGERYITQELKDLETTILGASDKISAIEYELFTQIRNHLSKNVRRIQSAAEHLAILDVYLSLAEVAVANDYVCPEVDISTVIDIKDGRHPVVEQCVTGGTFVPNDVRLDTENNRLLLITGPNMAGKSTYMRQIALICVMAQIGSFVPASDARIGIVDKLFTRVGASDDLAAGQSTFMLEMIEVANILKNATRRSLIVYDEVGRGTSTYDGMAIAKSVCEYTASKKIGARCLFATHYHELIELEGTTQGVVNYSIAARKKDNGVVFLRKIVRGGADDSYGIEVAQLAGVPKEVTKKAKQILAELIEKNGKPKVVHQNDDRGLVSFSMDDYLYQEIADKIRKTDINSMTPIDALNFLSELKGLIK